MVQVTFNKNRVTLIGDERQVGDQAPNFTVLTNELKEVSLDQFEGKVKLISVVPSVDTGVCAMQTKRFNDEAKKFGDVQVITISMDLPFAQKRWAEANDVTQLQIVSDHRDADFGTKYGVLIKELRLLTRSIFVVDESNTITYVEYVKEVTNHPDYDKVLNHLQSSLT